MSATKNNKCRWKRCNAKVEDQYFLCIEHRKCSIFDMKKYVADLKKPRAVLNRYFCDGCGTVSHAKNYTNCRACGKATEDLGPVK